MNKNWGVKKKWVLSMHILIAQLNSNKTFYFINFTTDINYKQIYNVSINTVTFCGPFLHYF